MELPCGMTSDLNSSGVGLVIACKVRIYSGNRDISICRRAKLTFIPEIEISLFVI